jgi:hypothetical protein
LYRFGRWALFIKRGESLFRQIANHVKGAVPDGKEIVTNSPISETCIWHDAEKSVLESGKCSLRFRNDSVVALRRNMMLQRLKLLKMARLFRTITPTACLGA